MSCMLNTSRAGTEAIMLLLGVLCKTSKKLLLILLNKKVLGRSRDVSVT